MSQKSFALHSGLKRQGGGEAIHSHSEAQLTYASSGIVQVHTTEGRWLVPSQLGVWIPAGVLHWVEVLTDAELWMVHWEPSAARDWGPSIQLDQTFAFRVTPLMHSLLNTAFMADSTPDKNELVVRLMLHELSETSHASTFLPMPNSPAGKRIADVALDDHRNQLSVEQVATRAATSVRTLSRLIHAETGLTFKFWRQRARIVRAMDMLSRGKAIAQVSAELGFASTASFSCAFRQVTNMTPTTFIGYPG